MRNPYKLPRAAHCIGCGYTFDKMHLMINHRRNDRCGGRFLPDAERLLYNEAKVFMVYYGHGEANAKAMAVVCYNSFVGLRDARLSKAG